MGGALVVYRWELRKLISQKRTYLGLGAAIVVPIIFVVALSVQNGQPNDVAFGRYVRESGLAIPLVLLLFGSIWLFPLITALVAGDIIASEHHNGTLKTIFTRSLDRGQIFTGKAATALTYALTALVVDGRHGRHRGNDQVGLQPARLALRDAGVGAESARARGGELRRLPDAARRDRLLRPAALGPHPQQRGRRRRDADVRAADAAHRDPARPRRRQSRTC